MKFGIHYDSSLTFKLCLISEIIICVCCLMALCSFRIEVEALQLIRKRQETQEPLIHGLCSWF